MPGCSSRGIAENVANGIFDDMIDFAEYAFNKSHAAGYALVAYQTAWLKYYYPVQFMAALMTSVIDSSQKVSEYILTCRNMGITLLPPDINQGQGGFSVSGNSIRYALTAIKSVGYQVIDSIVEERRAGGDFTGLQDFVTRTVQKGVTKRVLENFIKAGAMDGFGGTRKQFMSVYVQMVDQAVKDRKSNLEGQMSLFDIAEDSQKEEFKFVLPQSGEYPKEMLLAFEKEVLGIYISGHPLEAYQELWQKYITNKTGDFVLDEESGQMQVTDQAMAVVGGMIAEKNVKYTRNDKVMAFISLEDLVGTIEVVVFPKDYEKFSNLLTEEAKIFVKGRVSVEEDKNGKLICEQIVSFEDAAQVKDGVLFRGRFGGDRSRGKTFGGGGVSGFSGGEAVKNPAGSGKPASAEGAGATGQKPSGGIPKGIWIQFPDREVYCREERKLLSVISECRGEDNIIIFLKDSKAYKCMPPENRVKISRDLMGKLGELFGPENVKMR